jgi:hypothetical protein
MIESPRDQTSEETEYVPSWLAYSPVMRSGCLGGMSEDSCCISVDSVELRYVSHRKLDGTKTDRHVSLATDVRLRERLFELA